MIARKLIAAVAVFALALGVIAIADESSAADVTVEVLGEGDTAMVKDPATGVWSGQVVNTSAGETPAGVVTIKIAASGYVTYPDFTTPDIADDVKSIEAVGGIVTVEDFPVTGTDNVFVFAVTPGVQTSIDGLAVTEVKIAPTYRETGPFDLTWKVDGIVIATTSTDAPSIPSAPVKEYFDFRGWMIGAQTVIIWNPLATSAADAYVLADSLRTTTILTPEDYLGALVEDTIITASFEPVMMDVTFVAADVVVGVVSAPYGSTVMAPQLPEGFKAWDYDFTTPITAPVTIFAVEADPVVPDVPVTAPTTATFEIEGKSPVTQSPDSLVVPDTTREGYVFQGWVVKGSSTYVDPMAYEITESVTFVAVYKVASAGAYTVTFEIEGKTPITQKADSLAVPDTTRDGFEFQGWVVKGGSSEYVDPLTYEITSDITFTAVYKAIEITTYTVTFMDGEAVIGTVTVEEGKQITSVSIPTAPEGEFWLFEDVPVTADMTVSAVPVELTVSFAVDGKIFAAYTQKVPYGGQIDQTALADFVFPEGFDSWDFDFATPITADTTVNAKPVPAPVEEPGFLETPMGQCALILGLFVVGAGVAFAASKGLIKLPKRKVDAPVAEVPEVKEDKEEGQE